MPPWAYEDAMSDAAGTALLKIDAATHSPVTGYGSECRVTGRILAVSSSAPSLWKESARLPKHFLSDEERKALEGRIVNIAVSCLVENDLPVPGGTIWIAWETIKAANYMIFPIGLDGEPVEVYGMGLQFFERRPAFR